MNEKEFKKLINKKLYQIFIFESRLPVPFQFATHSWIVTSNKGKIKRWDLIWSRIIGKDSSKGHVYLNMIAPWVGMNKYLFKGAPKYPSKLIGYSEGNKNSLTEKAIKFLDKNARKYPFKKRYRIYPGPNSNTFIQWFLDKFPELEIRLSRRAFGKNYLRNSIP